jgi:Kef-type K+ transport system membrane component KefB
MIDYLPLSIILFSFVLGSIISIKFKIPSLIVFLVIGALVGTYGFIPQSDILSFMGELGSILLLFAIGTEFSLDGIAKNGFRKAGIIAAIEIILAMVILYLLFSEWFGASIAVLLALAFSITSTGTTVKLLQSLNLSQKFDISQIIKISIIEDLIAVFIFSVLSSFEIMHNQDLSSLAVSFFSSLILFVIAYYASSRVLNKMVYRYNISGEDMLMLALALLLMFVFIATYLDLSAAFGAYVAGSIVGGWKSRYGTIEADIKKFSYVFIAFFFFTIGLSVNLNAINLGLLLIILPIVVIVKLLSIFLGGVSALRDPRKSFFISASMLSIGELSLVIISAAVNASLMPSSFLGLSSFIVFFSIIISYAMIVYADRIYGSMSSISRRMRLFAGPGK